MDTLKALMRKFLAEEDGATMIEYALLAALVALVVAAALVTLNTALSAKFNDISDCVNNPSNTTC